MATTKSRSGELVGWKPQNPTPRSASTRIRCLNTLRELRGRGYPAELYRPARQRRYRAVVLSKARNRRDLELAEQLKASGVRIAFDMCDNHFVLDAERVALLRAMLELADHWVVSSEVLAQVVRDESGTRKPLTVIEDAVESSLKGPLLDIRGRLDSARELARLDRFLGSEAHRAAGHLVWFGNHRASYASSGLVHVSARRREIEAVHRIQPLTLTVISNSQEAFDEIFSDWKIPTHYMRWSAHSFFRALRRHDIAIIPIERNPFTSVKTNNRLALSLSLGLGVVADTIDSYRVFSECAQLDRWEEGLLAYLRDRGLIREHTHRARKIIDQHFSIAVIADKWQQFFDRLRE